MAANGSQPSWLREIQYEIFTGQDGLDFVDRAVFDRVVAETARRHLGDASLYQGPGLYRGVLEDAWTIKVSGAPEEKVVTFIGHLHRKLKKAGIAQDVIKVNKFPVQSMLVGYPTNGLQTAIAPARKNGNGHSKHNRSSARNAAGVNGNANTDLRRRREGA